MATMMRHRRVTWATWHEPVDTRFGNLQPVNIDSFESPKRSKKISCIQRSFPGISMSITISLSLPGSFGHLFPSVWRAEKRSSPGEFTLEGTMTECNSMVTGIHDLRNHQLWWTFRVRIPGWVVKKHALVGERFVNSW